MWYRGTLIPVVADPRWAPLGASLRIPAVLVTSLVSVTNETQGRRVSFGSQFEGAVRHGGKG